MRIVGVNGSHRADGNSGGMLAKALEVCESRGFEVRQIDLADKDIGFCTSCNLCAKRYGCSQDDDVMDILDALEGADGIIVASPTYFGALSGRLKSFFDRTFPLRRNGMMLAGKVGAVLSVGGSRNGGQEHVIQQIRLWMLIHEMTVVGDMQTAHFGGICVGRNPGDALKDETGMKTVMNTAENVCARLKK
jgi:multimeric flavodoxin WrbA